MSESKSSGAVPLYIRRPVLNAEELHVWMREQGFVRALHPDDMHVTIVYSKRPFSRDEFLLEDYDENVVVSPPYSVTKFDGGAVVLRMTSEELSREHEEYLRRGASSDYRYAPHVTLTYLEDIPTDVSVPKFPLVLGPRVASKITEFDATSDAHLVSLRLSDELIDATDSDQDGVKLFGVDEERRLVWGWAHVSTIGGTPYFDSYGHHVPIDVMESAAVQFMLKRRMGLTMHQGMPTAEIVQSFVLSETVCRSLGISCDREGWIVAFRVTDEETWEQVKDGKLPGMSIGWRGRLVDVV